MPILIFSLVLGLVLLILVLSLVLFYKDKKYVEPQATPVKKNSYRTLDECSIEELADRIAKEKLSESELLRVVSMVAKDHKFPGRSSENSAEHHLRFVHQFCLNDNADGSTIVKMSNTLKAINIDYKGDIEGTERAAVKKRDEKG